MVSLIRTEILSLHFFSCHALHISLLQITEGAVSRLVTQLEKKNLDLKLDAFRAGKLSILGYWMIEWWVPLTSEIMKLNLLYLGDMLILIFFDSRQSWNLLLKERLLFSQYRHSHLITDTTLTVNKFRLRFSFTLPSMLYVRSLKFCLLGGEIPHRSRECSES